MRASRNLKFLAAALAFVVGLGTVGFHYIEGWPWFDGFYMVITTLTTIGYEEVHPLSHAGRVFNIVIILSGVSLLFLLIGSLTQALLEFEPVTTLSAARDALAAAQPANWRAVRRSS